MKPTQQLHDLGQSLWLDNVTRESCGTKLGIAIAQRTYKAYRQLLDSGGCGWRTPAPGHSDCSGPARAQRTRPLQTFSTSRRSPRRLPSTRFLTKHCLLSRTMAQWESSWKLTAAMPKR